MRPKRLVPTGLVLLSTLMISCPLETGGGGRSEKSDPISIPTLGNPSLRERVEGEEFEIGALYHDLHVRISEHSDAYSAVLAHDFNSLSTTYSFAMDEIWTAEGDFNFRYFDFAVDFAREHQMTVHGTHLVWHGSTPEWLEDGLFTDAEFAALIEDYVTTVVSHGNDNGGVPITIWNVANEVVAHDGGGLRDTIFRQRLGDDYLVDLFAWAHDAADPTTLLFLNEYDILGNEEDNGEKADTFYGIVKDLVERDVPIDGVGFQAHMAIDAELDLEYSREQVRRFSALGLQVQITELDILVNNDRTGLNDQKLQEQAEMVGAIVGLCAEEPGCTGVTFWGVSDTLHDVNTGGAYWLDQSEDWPLLYDAEYRPKPAYFAVRDALAF